jgi:hypothetical protein
VDALNITVPAVQRDASRALANLTANIEWVMMMMMMTMMMIHEHRVVYPC